MRFRRVVWGSDLQMITNACMAYSSCHVSKVSVQRRRVQGKWSWKGVRMAGVQEGATVEA